MPYHLLFPFVAGILYVIGSLFAKRAAASGISGWSTAILANFCATAFMSVFWFLGGEPVDISLLWQPATIGLMYVIGQVLILAAITYGDVSVALPVASVKVIIVAAMVYLVTSVPPSKATWIAAILATVGVFLINFVAPKADKFRIMITVLLSVTGVTAFAAFDVCIQSWSNHWGTGRLLPISFWFAGTLTLFLLPKFDSLATLRSAKWGSLVMCGLLISGQALFMVYGLSAYGDAPRMNVVYALRGLWAVLLAWSFARWFGGAESQLGRKVMAARVFGAFLLVVGVIIAITAGSE